MRKGFTLLELVIVVVVIGILVALASPQFAVTKERALDKEARATISLIQAAEKVYRMEVGYYYPLGTTTTSIPNINTNLRLSLPQPANPTWNYEVSGSGTSATATRNKTGGRDLSITFTSDTVTCAPNSDVCYP